MLREVGLADVVIVRPGRNGEFYIIDGHLRQDELNQVVPCLVTDLSAKEADKLLATFDPIGLMATRHDAAMKTLLDSLSARDVQLQALLLMMRPPEEHGSKSTGGGSDPSSGHVSMIQLFFTESTKKEFDRRVESLASRYSTDTVTDTVAMAVARAAVALCSN